MKELGSFYALIDYHNEKQKETGLNIDRVDSFLSEDMNYGTIREMIDTGMVIDTSQEFKPIHHTADFRNLQKKLLPVYRKAVAGMHAQHKVLVFRVEDIPADV